SRDERINQLHAEIVQDLKQMLDEQNVLTKSFRIVRDKFQEDTQSNFRLRLIGKRNYDGRRYNLPTISEVVALVVGDFDVSRCDRDIIVETQSGHLQRINELNAAYLGLQYPLLFPFGEDGYREDIPLNGTDESTGGRNFVSMLIYTVEFQKRGLPHAHILLFLHNKYPNVGDIDQIISAEIPDESVDPCYYKAVKNFMMHGPCGSARKSSPCMRNGRCTKHFPKKFVQNTTTDEDGYPVYKRRDNGRTINKEGIDLDNRPSVKESKFLSWFEANNTYEEARELTYAEFPLKFVWNKKLKKWEKRRNSAFSIGRIFFVPPGSGEKYYLRMLLNVIRGPKSYEDLRKINNHEHLTFRDACYALGLLDDDKQYVDAIKEASHWGMASYLRQLFAMLLLSNSMSRPEYVWEATWILLSDDILHEQRRILD
ncbi:hypothetical protein A4A49_63775, partial [Nicotiana attenuata]